MSNGLKNIEDIAKKHPIILFDGVCNLCDNSVRFVIKNDGRNSFKFGALQANNVQEFLKQKNSKFSNIDSILLVTEHKIYTKSSAALTIAKKMKNRYSLLYIFYIIPKTIRDVFYDFIAQNRYKWYGKKDACMIPSKELQDKFI